MRAVVAGGGLAGLSAAWGLRQAGFDTLVLESAAVAGGSAAGFANRGYTFDFQPQSLAVGDGEVARLCEAWCGRPLLRGPRLVRILVDGKLYRHPPDARDLLGARGPGILAGMLAGRLQLRLGLGANDAPDYRSFMTARFGAPLYERFLGPIVEKITGLPASEIASDLARATLPESGIWSQAARRLLGRADDDHEHLVPEDGFTALPEGLARALERAGVEVLPRHRVTALRGHGPRIDEVLAVGPRGTARIRPDLVVSTLPVGALLAALGDAGTAEARDAARQLRTRALVVVHLGVRRDRLTEDHEILVPDPSVCFHRLSETVNYAPRMAPRGATGLTAEIACDEHDRSWNEEDGTHVRRVIDDLCALGFLRSTAEVEAAWVRRRAAALPVVTLAHAGLKERIDRALAGFSNLRRCGREGGLGGADPVARIRQGLRIAAEAAAAASRSEPLSAPPDAAAA